MTTSGWLNSDALDGTSLPTNGTASSFLDLGIFGSAYRGVFSETVAVGHEKEDVFVNPSNNKRSNHFAYFSAPALQTDQQNQPTNNGLLNI